MRKSILLILLSITILACRQAERSGEPAIYSLTNEDKEMNEAILEARSTFVKFLTALKNPTEAQSAFSVKVPFEFSNGDEHIWLSDIQLRDEKLYGYVNNVPENITNLKLGDEVEIDPKQISDWFYIDNNKLVGGLTIRVLRDRMTPEERLQFEQEFGVEFD